jgi:hypothetical protein
MPEATLDPPSRHYLCNIEKQITRFYRLVIKGCCVVVDGSLHQLEHDAEANAFHTNFYFHLDYNSWKGQICKKGLYFFSFNSYICNLIWDVPGFWHDGHIFDYSYFFIMSLLEGCWVLGDSAFPCIPRKMERVKKKNEYLL